MPRIPLEETPIYAELSRLYAAQEAYRLSFAGNQDPEPDE